MLLPFHSITSTLFSLPHLLWNIIFIVWLIQIYISKVFNIFCSCPTSFPESHLVLFTAIKIPSLQLRLKLLIPLPVIQIIEGFLKILTIIRVRTMRHDLPMHFQRNSMET